MLIAISNSQFGLYRFIRNTDEFPGKRQRTSTCTSSVHCILYIHTYTVAPYSAITQPFLVGRILLSERQTIIMWYLLTNGPACTCMLMNVFVNNTAIVVHLWTLLEPITLEKIVCDNKTYVLFRITN